MCTFLFLFNYLNLFYLCIYYYNYYYNSYSVYGLSSVLRQLGSFTALSSDPGDRGVKGQSEATLVKPAGASDRVPGPRLTLMVSSG